jgi:hypothetical protein
MSRRTVERDAIDDLKALIMEPTKELRPIRIQLDDFSAVVFSVGNGDLRIKHSNEKIPSEESCLIISIGKVRIELDDYYNYLSGISFFDRSRDCPPLSHEHFFKILDFLSFCFELPLQLVDLSTKQIKACNLFWSLMRLRSGRTFYERFGFRHTAEAKDAEYYKELEGTPIQDIVPLQLLNILNVLASAEEDAPTFDPLSSSVSEFAVWVYDVCDKGLRLTRTPIFTDVVDALHETIREDRQEKNLYQSYQRPRRTSMYSVKKFAILPLKESGHQDFYFVVRSSGMGGSRRAQKRTSKRKHKGQRTRSLS